MITSVVLDVRPDASLKQIPTVLLPSVTGSCHARCATGASYVALAQVGAAPSASEIPVTSADTPDNVSTTSRSRVVADPASIASVPAGFAVSSTTVAVAVAVFPAASAKQTAIVLSPSATGTVHVGLAANATRAAQLATPPSTIRICVVSAGAVSVSTTSRSCVYAAPPSTRIEPTGAALSSVIVSEAIVVFPAASVTRV